MDNKPMLTTSQGKKWQKTKVLIFVEWQIGVVIPNVDENQSCAVVGVESGVVTEPSVVEFRDEICWWYWSGAVSWGVLAGRDVERLRRVEEEEEEEERGGKHHSSTQCREAETWVFVLQNWIICALYFTKCIDRIFSKIVKIKD